MINSDHANIEGSHFHYRTMFITNTQVSCKKKKFICNNQFQLWFALAIIILRKYLLRTCVHKISSSSETMQRVAIYRRWNFDRDTKKANMVELRNLLFWRRFISVSGSVNWQYNGLTHLLTKFTEVKFMQSVILIRLIITNGLVHYIVQY